MERLSDCLVAIHSTWLANYFSCCLPTTLQEQLELEFEPHPEPAARGVRNNTELCYEQPLPQPPPTLPTFEPDEPRPSTRNSHRSSQWFRNSLDPAPRALSRASFSTNFSARRRLSHQPNRPTIGAPTEFRRVEPPTRRTGAFRPLQLSIYLPGNELPELPSFDEDDFGDETQLQRPAQALVKSRSDPLLSRQNSSFSIPRKPLPPRTSSLDAVRYSMDSTCVLKDAHRHPRSRSVDHLKYGPLERKPTTGPSQSTQDFLAAIDTRVQTPPQVAARSSSGPEETSPIYRRASEQNLRLRTHLQEREQMERRLPDCDTIMEEKSPAVSGTSPISPLSDQDRDIKKPIVRTHTEAPWQTLDWFRPSAHGEAIPMSQARSSTSSTLLNPLTPHLNAAFPDLEAYRRTRPMVATSISTIRVPAAEPASVAQRLSQWFLKSLPPSLTTPNPTTAKSTILKSPSIDDMRSRPYNHNRNLTQSSSHLSLYSISAPTVLSSSTPWTSTRSRAHTYKSSTSTFASKRGASFDVDAEKVPDVPVVSIVKEVGVAF